MTGALEHFSGPSDPPEVGRASVDGLPWTVERGVAGDLLLRWGDRGTWWVAPDAGAVVAAGDEDDPGWRRVAQDSVRATVALARGHEALHAAVVHLDTRGAVAVLGGQGAGKTTSALALLHRGGRLVADDVAVLDRDEPAVVLPGPPTMNLPHSASVPGTDTPTASVPGTDTPVPVPGTDTPVPVPGTEVLHRFDDEDWVRLPAGRVVDGPVTLRAVVLLDRTAPAGAEPGLEPLPFAAPVLLAHALDSGRRREAARFSRLAALAEAVEVLRLRAPAGTPADVLAGVLAR